MHTITPDLKAYEVYETYETYERQKTESMRPSTHTTYVAKCLQCGHPNSVSLLSRESIVCTNCSKCYVGMDIHVKDGKVWTE